MKQHLKRRMRDLWTFELLNAAVIFPLFYYTLSLHYRLGWFSTLALGMVSAIMIVGAAFWFLKGWALSGSTRLYHPATRRIFRASKIAFGVALVALAGLFAARIVAGVDASWAEWVIGGGLALMALLEYVNYYYIQLSYDNRADLAYLRAHRRLKRAVMVRELGI
jgi:hypothetical protein